jgi:FAD/FMN-containing dehydrogenase
MVTIENEAVRELKSRVSGQVLLPSDPGYDEARTIWNAMIDRRPAVIVRCANAQDVIQATRSARERNLVLVVRGGGHMI